MKADLLDYSGTASAEISHYLGEEFGFGLESFGKHFKLDQERFKVIGISIYGTESHFISLLCIDKLKSTVEKKHVVSMSINIENDKDILSILFKRLHIVLHDRFDEKYPDLNYDEEVRYDDFHELENEEE